MEMNKVYLSGPITGLSLKDAKYGWRREFAERLPWKFKVLSPMRHVGPLAEDTQGLFLKQFTRPKWMVAKDLLDIKECSVMVLNLLGSNAVSIGSVAELGYAHALGKTVVTILEEGNIHDHSFISEMSSIVVPTVDAAIVIVNSLLSEGI